MKDWLLKSIIFVVGFAFQSFVIAAPLIATGDSVEPMELSELTAAGWAFYSSLSVIVLSAMVFLSWMFAVAFTEGSW